MFNLMFQIKSVLQVLDLGNNNVTEKGMNMFAPCLRRMIALEELILSANPFGDEGALTLVPYLEDLDHIRRLDLSFSNVTMKSLSKMLELGVNAAVFCI